MDLYAVIDQVVTLLQQRGRLTYRALQYQFTLDDAGLEALKAELMKYPNVTKIVWAQEEPQNMGAWNFMMPRLRDLLDQSGFADRKLRYAGRKPSSSPAVGSKGLSDLETKKLIEQAFTV